MFGPDKNSRIYFPSFSEGLSLRIIPRVHPRGVVHRFPFLFGGTFIEENKTSASAVLQAYFPSFSEGLSLRTCQYSLPCSRQSAFPFLFGGTFIEEL